MQGKSMSSASTVTGPDPEALEDGDPCALRDLVLQVLEDAKAQDIEVFDLRERNTFADFMVVASGTSSRQNKAMADRLSMKIKTLGLSAPLGVEGQQEGEWVLVDLNDVVVHLMLPQTRAFYNLEKLWDETTRSRPAQSS